MRVNSIKKSVEIREVGLRDGLQLLDFFVATSDKIKWLDRLVPCGFKEVEVTSFVPPSVLPQFKDAKEILHHACKIGINAAVLVPNLKGAMVALEEGAPKITFVVSASNAHSLANVKRPTEIIIEQIIGFLYEIKSLNIRPMVSCIIATSFGCSISGEVKEALVIEIANRLYEHGADEISFADTVGYGHPYQVKSLISAASKTIPLEQIAVHFHDTRGLGIANMLAAYEMGVLRFDTALGGLGGCPFAPGASGNIATEDTIYALHAMGIETGIDFENLMALRKSLVDILAPAKLAGHLYKAGIAKTFKN